MRKGLARFLSILGKENLNLSFLVIFGTIISALLEMVSIGSIIPILTLIFSGELTGLDFLKPFISNFSEENLYGVFISILLCVFVFKTIYQGIFYYFLGLYSSKIYFDISSRLYSRYLKRDYLDHIKENSADKIQLINTESNMSVQGFLKPFMVLLTEAFTILGISLILIYIDYKSFFTLFTFLSLIFLLSSLSTRKVLKNLGEKRTDLEIKKLKELQQSFFGFKFIKLSNSLDFVAKSFKEFNWGVASIRAKEFFLKQFIRPVLELSVIFGILILTYFLYSSGKSKEDILILISLYLASAIRLLPSLNRIMGSLQNMNFYLPVIDRLFEAFYLENGEKHKSKVVNKNIQMEYEFSYITFQDVSFRFDSGEKNILNNINLSFDRSSFIGIIGESGTGKSTFLNILSGLIQPNSGSVFFKKQNIFELQEKWYSKIGFVPQDVYLVDDSIRNNIAFGIDQKKINEEKILKAAKQSNLLDFINMQEFGLDTIIGENATNISGGQKQRLAIARALYHDPEILIFDEATSSLDEKNEKQIIEQILTLKKEKTIFFVSHNPDSLKQADRVLEFKNQSIIDSNG